MARKVGTVPEQLIKASISASLPRYLIEHLNVVSDNRSLTIEQALLAFLNIEPLVIDEVSK